MTEKQRGDCSTPSAGLPTASQGGSLARFQICTNRLRTDRSPSRFETGLIITAAAGVNVVRHSASHRSYMFQPEMIRRRRWSGGEPHTDERFVSVPGVVAYSSLSAICRQSSVTCFVSLTDINCFPVFTLQRKSQLKPLNRRDLRPDFGRCTMHCAPGL
jgi:hypothetical protein